MFDQKSVKKLLDGVMAANPTMTFQQAWSELQKKRPDLFDDVPNHASTSALLAHNKDIRSLNDQLMKYARGGDATYAKKGAQLVQAIEERYGELPSPDWKLVES